MLLLCNYYVTYRCNAFCEFCDFANHAKFSYMPFANFEEFKSNVSQLAKLGVKFIDLTGGEPLLHKYIAEMAEFARTLKMQTSITTNCLLYPKFAEKLAGKVNLLHFSIDSPDEVEHNKIRGVKCFHKIFESIRIAQSIGEFPDLLFTATNETYFKLPRIYEIARKYDLALIVNPVFSYFGNPGLKNEALDFIDQFVKDKSDIYMNPSFIEIRRRGGNDKNDPICKAVSRTIVISPYNEIILPCYHFGDKKIKIDRPIAEILKSDEYKFYKKMEGRFEFCHGCELNCYFEPSLALPINYLSIVTYPSKFKYAYIKLVKQKIKKIKKLWQKK